MGVKGKGAKIWLYDANGAALRKLGEVYSITPAQRTRDTIDTTHHESSGDYREFISALIDAGEVTATLAFDPTSVTEALCETAFGLGDIRTFAIDMNKSATPAVLRRFGGSCIVTGWNCQELVIDDKQTGQLTLKVSGPIVQSNAP